MPFQTLCNFTTREYVTVGQPGELPVLAILQQVAQGSGWKFGEHTIELLRDGSGVLEELGLPPLEEPDDEAAVPPPRAFRLKRLNSVYPESDAPTSAGVLRAHLRAAATNPSPEPEEVVSGRALQSLSDGQLQLQELLDRATDEQDRRGRAAAVGEH